MKCYFKHVEPVYYVDSKLRMLSIIAREWLEITTQIYALLLYGGINVFALESNVLSQKAYIIQSFCVIISMNCITGMTGHVRALLTNVVVFYCFCDSWFIIGSLCLFKQISSWKSVSFIKFCN